MLPGPAPPLPPLRRRSGAWVPVAPAPLRLLGAKAVCRRPSAPCAPAAARRPGSAVRCAAASGPPSLRGFGCRLRRHRCAVAVPAPACCLGLSAPAAARPSAAAPGPPPPRCGPCCGPARLGPPALARVAAVALGCCGRACGPPSAACGLPAFPGAAPGGGAPRVGPSRRLPSVVPPSVGGLVGLRCARAPGLPPGPPAALRAAFSGPPARAWGLGCSAAAAAGQTAATGGGCHLRRWGSRVKPGGCAALDPPPPAAAFVQPTGARAPSGGAAPPFSCSQTGFSAVLGGLEIDSVGVT